MTRALCLTLALMVILTSSVQAASSTFPLQGTLLSGSTPVSGIHSVTLSLFDVQTGGTAFWAENQSITVNNGLYTTVLGNTTPLPSSNFTGQTTWLEIVLDGTTLSPRLIFQPYAITAPGAGDSLWQTDGTNVWRAGGNVGIGISSPQASLDIATNPGYELRFSGTDGANIFSPDQSLYLLAGPGKDILLGSNGNDGTVVVHDGLVGIGTGNPINKLQVSGGGVCGDWITTPGASLGNGSVYPLLTADHLGFYGSYGYAVGDEYIEFQSGYNPGIGGNGSMARITADRNPEDYDLGRGRIKLSVRKGASLTDVLTVDYQGVTINGSLNVSQTKCRVVTTPSYGELKMNANESAYAWFSTEGEAKLTNGRARIDLDPKWLETVTINDTNKLRAFITFYGTHGDFYVERDLTGFTVIDPSGGNAEFSWKVEAKQRGYENTYLEAVSVTAEK